MSIPTFDLDAVLSDRAKYIGELPWLNTAPVTIKTIAPKEDDAEKAVVVTMTPHGLTAGERVFVGGYGPTVDHFYEVEDHPDVKHRKAAFVIGLRTSTRLGQGSLYAPELFQILHPQHLSLKANIEMQSLELRHLEVLKAISPQNYQKTMLLLLKSVSGAANAENLRDDIESLTTKLGDGSEGDEIDPQAIGHIRQIELEIQLREIEILCSMPKGHMNAMSNKAGMAEVIRQIHGFIGDLIKQTNDEAKGESGAEAAPKKPRSRKQPDDTETIAKAS